MSAPLSARSARRRFLLLSLTRWWPVGLTFGMTVLLPTERGIPLGQLGVILAAQGLLTLVLEVPTGSVADTWGRRPLLVVAGVIALGSTVLFLAAHDLWVFVLASALQGVYRALDSGPLEAWFVDAVTSAGTDSGGEQGDEVERGLARAGTVLGLAIAGGAVVGGALVWWHPLSGQSAFVLPFALSAACILVHTVLTAVLVREPRRGDGSDAASERTTAADPAHVIVATREATAPVTAQRPTAPAQAPTAQPATGWRALGATIASGWAVLRGSRVLQGLVLVEAFWALAMLGFETLTPLRLADLLGTEAAAAALFAPASAAAWALFAAGSWVAELASRRWGAARGALAVRVVNGLFVALMGLTAGPVGLLAAYALAYLSHGAAGPLHNTLLHRCATSQNRALILSLNSMVASGVYALAMLAALPLAQLWGTGPVLILLGLLSTLGALFYLPAVRDERRRAVSLATAPARGLGKARARG